jgi:hypothetical protein
MSTNAGVRDGVPGAAVDVAFARRALQAEALLGYLSALATTPRAGGDRVDPAVVAAQLFRRANCIARAALAAVHAPRADAISGPEQPLLSAAQHWRSPASDASQAQQLQKILSCGGLIDGMGSDFSYK